MGLSEFEDENGELLFFDDDSQFITKIMNYDDDTKKVIDNLFHGFQLKDIEHDTHFKKTFIFKFLNREINRQTIEAFKLQLMMTCLTQEHYMNIIYTDMERFITSSSVTTSDSLQKNDQKTDGESIANNRQAYAELPQNNVNIDLNDDTMTSANDNTISKNNQLTQQHVDGETETSSNSETKQYQLETLFQSSGILENLLTIFDRKCFLQVW